MRWPIRLAALACCVALAACAGKPQPPAPPPSDAPNPGNPGAFALTEIIEGLNRPLSLTHAGDGSNRLFVVEQTGKILVVKDGKVLAQPFLDVSSLITTKGNEQGLLGLAFHPNFKQNGTFYVHYSGKEDGRTTLARYKVSAQNPDQADPSSAEVLLTHEQPYSNHNGGAIAFGPDGYLYMALGDGGSGGDPQNHAQNLETLLGKILRLDEDGRPAPGNPFAEKPGRDEIWAFGLRNPWRMSFDRATGDLYIADVGQNKYEEINFQPKGSKGGENYGWKVYEANERFSPGTLANHVPPVAAYSHDLGCSVTGGFVYRGKAIASLAGTYIYADYCTGRIFGLTRDGDKWTSRELTDTDLRISSFGEDEAGEMYVVDHGGKVYRMSPR